MILDQPLEVSNELIPFDTADEWKRLCERYSVPYELNRHFVGEDDDAGEPDWFGFYEEALHRELVTFDEVPVCYKLNRKKRACFLLSL